MGAVHDPLMKRATADYAVNVTTHASLVGALMPTSHNMIIFTLAASGGEHRNRSSAACVVPALFLTICQPGGGLPWP